MISLYESILQSTNSGKYHAPLEWSKEYTKSNYKKAAKEFCKCYKVEKELELKVQSIFYAMSNYQQMQTYVTGGKLAQKLFSVDKFTFVQDPLFVDKLEYHTKYNRTSLGNFASLYGLNERLYFAYFASDNQLFFFNQATQKIEHISNNIFINYLKGK